MFPSNRTRLFLNAPKQFSLRHGSSYEPIVFLFSKGFCVTNYRIGFVSRVFFWMAGWELWFGHDQELQLQHIAHSHKCAVFFMLLLFSWNAHRVIKKKKFFILFCRALFQWHSDLDCGGKRFIFSPQRLAHFSWAMNFGNHLSVSSCTVPLNQSSSEPNTRCWPLCTSYPAAMMMASLPRTSVRWVLGISRLSGSEFLSSS